MANISNIDLHKIEQTDIERYEPIKQLGSGAYGIVCEALDKKTNKNMAIKFIGLCAKNDGPPKSFRNELLYTSLINHPNIIKYYAVVEKFDKYNLDMKWRHLITLYNNSDNYWFRYFVGLVMDVYDGDITDLICDRSITNSNIKSEIHVDFAYQLVNAVAQLSTCEIIHLDIRPRNILYSYSEGKYRLIISDFGMANKTKVQDNNYCVPSYRPPEIALSMSSDCKADVWSLGCVLHIIRTGKLAFKINKNKNKLIMENILKFVKYNKMSEQNEFQSIFEKWIQSNNIKIQYIGGLSTDFPEYDDLLSKMLEIDPNKRIGIKEALEHKIFDSYKSDNNTNFEPSGSLTQSVNVPSINLHDIYNLRFYRINHHKVLINCWFKWLLKRIYDCGYEIRHYFLVIFIVHSYVMGNDFISSVQSTKYRNEFNSIIKASSILTSYFNRQSYMFSSNDIKNKYSWKILKNLNYNLNIETPYDELLTFTSDLDNNVSNLACDILINCSTIELYFQLAENICHSKSMTYDNVVVSYKYRSRLSRVCCDLSRIMLSDEIELSSERPNFSLMDRIISYINNNPIEINKQTMIGININMSKWNGYVTNYESFKNKYKAN